MFSSICPINRRSVFGTLEMSAAEADIVATTHEAVKVFVEKGPPSILVTGIKLSSGQVEIHGDKLDGPSAFFAQRSGRVHGCDAERLVTAVRLDDE